MLPVDIFSQALAQVPHTFVFVTVSGESHAA